MAHDAQQRRADWQRRWQDKQGAEFSWHTSEVPEQLSSLLEHTEIPAGAALDLGCGAGVATAYIAGRRKPTVGLDIAFGAVAEARRTGGDRAAAAAFVVADASRLPFRPGSFAFIFDRGCLQNLPRPAWSDYFTETEQVLRHEGTLQVLCSKGVRARPPLLSKRGLRVRVRRLLGKGGAPGGPQFLSQELLRGMAPPSMAVVSMEEFPYDTTTGKRRTFVHGIFRKA